SFPARVLEDNVGIFTVCQLPDLGAEPLPFAGVLLVFILPEPITFLAAINDQFSSHRAANRGLVRGGDHADGRGSPRQRELSGVGAETAGRTPDEDVVALFHRGTIAC